MSRDTGLIRCILVAVRQNTKPLPPSTLEERYSRYFDIETIRECVQYLCCVGEIRKDSVGDLIS